MVDKGVLTPEQRDRVLDAQKQCGGRFGEVVVALGFSTENQVADCLAEQYDLPRAQMAQIQPTKEALRLVSPTFALSRLMLPVRVDTHEFHCVVSDPLDIQATDYLTRAIGKRLILSVASGSEVFEAITKWYAIPTQRPKLEIPKEAAAPVTAKHERPARKVKIVDQPDRKALLCAIEGSGDGSLWDMYGA